MSSETLKGLEPSAWRTHHDEPMLFPTFDEAAMYCDEEEPPEPLYAATAINAWIVELVQQRDELLAALEKAEEYLRECANAPILAAGLRAAIAKVKP